MPSIEYICEQLHSKGYAAIYAAAAFDLCVTHPVRHDRAMSILAEAQRRLERQEPVDNLFDVFRAPGYSLQRNTFLPQATYKIGAYDGWEHYLWLAEEESKYDWQLLTLIPFNSSRTALGFDNITDDVWRLAGCLGCNAQVIWNTSRGIDTHHRYC